MEHRPATGAYALTRRRRSGLLVVAMALPLAFAGEPWPALVWLVLVLLVFGTPFALAWREPRSTGTAAGALPGPRPTLS